MKERALLLARGDAAKAAHFEAEFRTAYHDGGPEGFLRKHFEILDEAGITPENRTGGRVETSARLHDKDRTFAALEEAERQRHPIIDYIQVDPYFDFLRTDPRYAELLARLKVPKS
jgi:hypothetical protein